MSKSSTLIWIMVDGVEMLYDSTVTFADGIRTMDGNRMVFHVMRLMIYYLYPAAADFLEG